VDLNLDTLKREILGYLEEGGFAVFHGSSSGLESGPGSAAWDTEHYPDYQMFLDVARKVDAKVILFASRELEQADLDDLVEQLDASDLPRDEQREFRSRLRDLRTYIGVTCTIELAFDHSNRMYIYEVRPDWFDEFLEIEDEIMSRLSDEDMDSDDSLGGYFSKN
jgi:hypothetical protein